MGREYSRSSIFRVSGVVIGGRQYSLLQSKRRFTGHQLLSAIKLLAVEKFSSKIRQPLCLRPNWLSSSFIKRMKKNDKKLSCDIYYQEALLRVYLELKVYTCQDVKFPWPVKVLSSNFRLYFLQFFLTILFCSEEDKTPVFCVFCNVPTLWNKNCRNFS